MQRTLHILIIDDDPDDTDFLASAFSHRQPKTRFTIRRNGQEGIDFLLNAVNTRDCPDVVFLDLHMPGKHGYKVLKELHESAVCGELPIMVISTSMQESEAQKCREAGCSGYFVKPNSLEGYDDIVNTTFAYIKFNPE